MLDMSRAKMAPAQGFEPWQAVLEAAVLPLHYADMAESQGVEPCDPFYLIYGLANRCITVLPTLHKLAAPHGFEPQ